MWKLANVVLIYKGKGSKTKVENYRLISSTNICCKLMETLVRNKIPDYLDANNLLFHSQWGFRPSRSNLPQLLLARSNLIECFNERACMDAVNTDLRKVFDRISHKKLLIKMCAYGINPSVL